MVIPAPKNTAKLSRCRQYRYALWRTWSAEKPIVMFIGLNPSTADETSDDPTLRRCINFAKAWGYGGVCMANLFAYRATDPEEMRVCAKPVGPRNNRWLKLLAGEADLVVAAWGNDGVLRQRSRQVRAMLPTMTCLRMNKSGEPAHPLYLPASLRPKTMSATQ
ncbi:MAG: DUF1643 domain-containing protein [Pseudomonadota bacterium]